MGGSGRANSGMQGAPHLSNLGATHAFKMPATSFRTPGVCLIRESEACVATLGFLSFLIEHRTVSVEGAAENTDCGHMDSKE